MSGGSNKIIGTFQSVSGKADSVLTTKADLASYSTERVRFPVGADGKIIIADSTQSIGLKYALFDSLYQTHDLISVVSKQRMVEYFSGSAINADRWTSTNITGTGSFAMDDSINGGFVITSGSSSGDRQQINFNDKRQYNNEGSSIIGIIERVDNAQVKFGLFNQGTTDNNINRAFVENGATQTYYRLGTADGSSQTMTDTDVGVDTTKRIINIVLTDANCKLYIDGTLKATSTSNLPADKLQPIFQNRALTNAAVTGKIQYCEVHNT
jgi:hypothetical protein